MPQILIGRQLGIDALRLKNHADLAAQTRGILAASHPMTMARPAVGNHQCRENSEQSGFAAAIRTEQSKQLRRAHVEGNAIQRGAVLITMDQILNGNYGRGGCARVPDRHRRVQRLLRPKNYPGDCKQFTTSGRTVRNASALGLGCRASLDPVRLRSGHSRGRLSPRDIQAAEGSCCACGSRSSKATGTWRHTWMARITAVASKRAPTAT